MRYEAQCAFCPSGCIVHNEQAAQSWKKNHARVTEHVVTIAQVRP